MIPGSANPLLLAGAEAGYAIERSVRFNSSDSAYLGATFGTPTDQDVFTLSMWVKRSALGSTQQLFGVSTSHSFGFTSGDALNLTFGGSSALTTTALFRDPSAWYHIVWKQNANAHELYVNGVSVGTATATSNTFNTAVAHQIGAANTTNYFNGYLADIHFIDGQALDPTSFGEFDDNGIWQPIAYSGSYGTNGFHLPFNDNSSAAALGTDTSGNSNTWTVNNISVAAGAGNDSLVDVPTNGTETDTSAGGEVRGNYCTLNPLYLPNGGSLSNGNLLGIFTGGNLVDARDYGIGTLAVSSGKWYYEIEANCSDTGRADRNITGWMVVGTYSKVVLISNTESSAGFISLKGTALYNDGSSSTYGSGYSNGDIIGVSIDLDNNTVQWYINGSGQGSVSISNNTYVPMIGHYDGLTTTANINVNFGQRPFAYTAPSGFKALCTANLPSTTITTSGSYTGNGVADGPFVYLNGVPTAMTVGGNAVTFGTHADKLSNGFKIRTTSTTYNQNASTYNYTITSTGDPFKTARAQIN